MKRSYITFTKSALLLTATLLFSCTPTEKPDPDQDPDQDSDPDPEEDTISGLKSAQIFGCEQGSSVTLNLVFTNDWEVVSLPEWLTAEPMNGEKGGQAITFTTTSANETLEEISGKFTIKCGTAQQEWIAVQRGQAGLFLESEKEDLWGINEVKIVLKATKEQDIKVTGDSWISKVSQKAGNPERVPGTPVVSEYIETTVTLSLQDNPSENDVREGTFTLTLGESSESFTVKQIGSKWANTEFYRVSLGHRFTATWCGYCPMMGEAYKEAAKTCGDRLIQFNTHSGGTFGWSETEYYQKLYKCTGGIPISSINGYSKVENYAINSQISIIEALVQEATDSNKSYTGIAAKSTTSGDNITIEAEVTCKLPQPDMRIFAFVLEDKLIGNQTDYTGAYPGNPAKYEHNNVVRGVLTPKEGEPFEIASGETKKFTITGTYPKNVYEKSNAYLVIYVTYAGEPQVKAAKNAKYVDSNIVIDNVIKLPMDGSVELRYEE